MIDVIRVFTSKMSMNCVEVPVNMDVFCNLRIDTGDGAWYGVATIKIFF